LLSDWDPAGNGIVWRCSKLDGSKAAVKVLTKVKKIAYSRFRAEVQVLNANTDVPASAHLGTIPAQ